MLERSVAYQLVDWVAKNSTADFGEFQKSILSGEHGLQGRQERVVFDNVVAAFSRNRVVTFSTQNRNGAKDAKEGHRLVE